MVDSNNEKLADCQTSLIQNSSDVGVWPRQGKGIPKKQQTAWHADANSHNAWRPENRLSCCL